MLKENFSVITHILSKAKDNSLSVDIVTNGVDLKGYIDLFVMFKDVLKHLQITLDGIKEIHDSRRAFHNGNGSFDLILDNIKLAIENNIKVYLRVNVDDNNIDALPLLADLIIKKFDNNSNLLPYLYLLQDGGCSGESNIVSEYSGIERIFKLEENHPNMIIFNKKYHPSEFIKCIFENIPYQPVLRHCGASKNQYIFDCKSNIYKCWHGIGNNDYRVGVFNPKYEINETKANGWKNRAVTKISKCLNCKYRYICGTGCPAVKHKDKSTMNISEPSCVDYQKLLDILIRYKMKTI